MSDYIAFLDSNNLVTQVVQAPDDGQDWASIYAERSGCTCLTTSIDGSFRHRFALTGFTYYPDLDAFIEPSPYPSWVLNTTTKQWEPPIAAPESDEMMYWDESITNWALAPWETGPPE